MMIWKGLEIFLFTIVFFDGSKISYDLSHDETDDVFISVHLHLHLCLPVPFFVQLIHYSPRAVSQRARAHERAHGAEGKRDRQNCAGGCLRNVGINLEHPLNALRPCLSRMREHKIIDRL